VQPHGGRNAENEFNAFSFKRRLYGSQPAHLGIKVLNLSAVGPGTDNETVLKNSPLGFCCRFAHL
jgi:hypothetical protein